MGESIEALRVIYPNVETRALPHLVGSIAEAKLVGSFDNERFSGPVVRAVFEQANLRMLF